MKKYILPSCLLIVLTLVFLFFAGSVTAGQSEAGIPGLSRLAFPYVPGEVIVKFRKDAPASTNRVVAGIYGLAERKSLLSGRFSVMRLPDYMSVEEAINSIGTDPAVEYVEPNYIRRAMVIPDDPFYPNQWGLQETGMADAWDQATGDSAIVVAVIDTGIDLKHPDLQANVWSNQMESSDGIDNDHNGLVDDIRGWDFINGDNDPSDDNGHGTHVAGIIGAVGNNATGVTGLNWRISLMPLKILDADGFGSVAEEILAISYAIEKGVNVINASFGGAFSYSNTERDAIQAALNAGILYIAAAGNGGPDFIGDDNDSVPFYPSGYGLDNIISVTAVTRNGALATYGNFGKNSVDLGAPGDGILSTVPSTYGSLSGTSMATAFVSGLASLLQSVYGTIDFRGIKNIILESVTPAGTLQGITVTGGMMNGARAVSALLGPTGLSVTGATDHSVRLDWEDNSSLEEGFRILRKEGSGEFNNAGSIPTDVTAFEDTGLLDGVQYTYRVVAYNSRIGESDPSEDVSVMTLLSPPSGLTAEVLSTDSVRLRWADNSGSEDGYLIERSEEKGGFVEVARLVSNMTEFTDRNLQSGVTYRYRVKAFSSVAGESSWSNEVSVKTASGGTSGSSGGGGGGGCTVTESGVGDGGLLLFLFYLMILFHFRGRRS